MFHGAFGSPESNWLPELKDKLESLGQEVIVPEFPIDEWSYIENKGSMEHQKSNAERWFVFEPIAKSFALNENFVLSDTLGPVFSTLLRNFTTSR